MVFIDNIYSNTYAANLDTRSRRGFKSGLSSHYNDRFIFLRKAKIMPTAADITSIIRYVLLH